jgi:hypothetical protein
MIRVTVIPISIIILILSVNYSYQDVLAMHDSQLDVNTWIANDNVTQLHTIDLNNGPVSSSATTEGIAPNEVGDANGEDPTVLVTPTDNGGEQDTGDEGTTDNGSSRDEDSNNGDEED